MPNPGRPGGPRRWRAPAALLFAALLGAAALPAALAARFSDSARATNFRVTATAGTAGTCFTLNADAKCADPDGRCCLGAGAEVSKLLLLTNGFNPACSDVSAAKITVNGQTVEAQSGKADKRPAIKLPLDSGALGGPVTFCIDPSGITGCSTIGQLCGGRLCSFRFAASGAHQGSGEKAKCSVDAAVENGDAGAQPLFSFQLVNPDPSDPYKERLDRLMKAAARRWEDALNVQMPPGSLPNGLPVTGAVLVYYQSVTTLAKGTYGVTELLDPRRGLGGGKRTVPLSGTITFNRDKLGSGSPSDAAWGAIVLHELGHFLGVGITALWEERGCIPSKCGATLSFGGGGPETTYYYKCAAARAQYRGLGCGKALRIESNRGSGQDCVHFAEKDLPNELMTPVVGTGVLSRVTLGAVEDIWGRGSINYGVADPWLCGGGTSTIQAAALGAVGSPKPEVSFELIQPDWTD
ncbi:hypothetical protein Rsub_02748 [Raphidocelis subcapitata]|uniref:Pherophorin domain-containing protein n=1 Tax=Raphidocelis subcapitata TaxID=307507 RepID=A0A2V0NWU2_9CHLO|nr:hypothetical protein Rsub_02748 [Raphidocelis subcapitata]|eukprot:GBF90040.1 hypothetical protein Rsub_02748 [Raphidocelis subcapitata]